MLNFWFMLDKPFDFVLGIIVIAIIVHSILTKKEGSEKIRTVGCNICSKALSISVVAIGVILLIGAIYSIGYLFTM